MTDMFISYSRRDQDFVRELYALLKTANRDPWVDWEGVQPTARWLREVYDAIESADSFLFVLSPDSIVSDACRLELDHALQCKKRIIPVVRADIDTAHVPIVLGEINWIFFRAGDDREDAFRKLEFALDTDLQFWKLSASLLVRARQWEDRRKDRGILLRGKELNEAEQWLAKSVDIKPTPILLQIEFIHASRRATTRRQRTTTSVFAATTSIFLILAIISLLLFQNANTQQRIATQQRNVAIARQLALESGIALTQGTPDLALLLGVEATKINADVQTRDALLNALTDNPHLMGMYHAPPSSDASTPNGSVSSLAISPDGKTLYGTGSGLFAWDMSAPTHAPRTLALPEDLTGSRPPSISSLTLSHDGRLLAVIAPQRVSLVNAATGAILQKIEPHDIDSAIAAIFSPDDTHIEIAYAYEFDPNGPHDQERIQVRQYGTRTATQIGAPFETADESIQPYLFSHDGSLLALGECADYALHCAKGQVSIWSVAQRRRLATLSIAPGGVTAMAFSRDDSLLAIGTCTLDSPTGDFRCNHGTIEIWSVASKSLVYAAQVRNELGEVAGLVFSPNGRYLLASLRFGDCSGNNCNQGQMQLWLVEGLKMVGEPFVGHLVSIGAMVFLPDGIHVLTAGGDASAYEWVIRDYDAISPYIILPDQQRAIGDSRPVYSPSGANLIMRNGLGIYTWDPLTGATLGKLPIRGTGFVTLSADGRLAAECENDTVLWDVSGGQLIRHLSESLDITPCLRATFSPDGNYLATVFPNFNTDHSAVVIWNVATGEMVRRIVLAPVLDIQVAFSADGSKIATLSERTKLELWDRATGAVLMRPVKIDKSLDTLPLSLHGNMVALAHDDGIATSFDTQMLKGLLSQPAAGSSGVDGLVAYSADGRYLATFSYYSLTIWDVVQGTPYVHFPHPGPDSLGAAFSPDGHYLSWDDQDGVVVTRSLRVADWQSAACTIASRNLTRAEWAQYVGSISYAKVCPAIGA